MSLSACMCVYYVWPGAYEDEKIPWNWSSEYVVEITMWVLGIQSLSSGGAASTL